MSRPDEDLRLSRQGNSDPVLRARWYTGGYYQPKSIAERIAETAARRPLASMVFAGEHRAATTDLATIDQRARRVAAGLSRHGIKSGDRVAVQVPNRIEGVVATHALWYLGAVVVPVVHIYGPRELEFILRQSAARALVIPDRWGRIDYLSRLAALPSVPTLETVIVIGKDVPAGMVPWSRLEKSPGIDRIFAGHPDSVAMIAYTSGTSADPKGVAHSHNTLLAEIRWSLSFIDAAPNPVSLAAFPAGHVAGALELLRATVGGRPTVWMDRWDAERAAALIERYAVTTSSGAQVHLTTLLEAARQSHRNISTLSAYLAGASAISSGVIEAASAAGIAAYRSYGSSEHPVLSNGSPSDPVDLRAATDGRVAPGSEIRIVDRAGADVQPGMEGELLCRGPQQCLGYTDSQLNRDAYDADGWFRTGDVARMDARGYLTITDRLKDVIIRGGETLSSKAIEDVLTEHPDIAEAAVIAVPDLELGERVGAFVVLRPGRCIDLAEIGRHFAAAGAARQKTPERLHVVTELPRTASGKVKKELLRARLRGR